VRSVVVIVPLPLYIIPMSSIYKRGGYWVYQVYVRDPITGSSRKVYKSLDLPKNLSKKEIEQIKSDLDKVFREQKVKETLFPSLYLSSSIQLYLDQKRIEVKQNRRSPHTLRTDKNCLNLFENYIKEHYGDIDIKKITRKHIIRWKEQRYTEVNSPTTISVNMRTVRSFFSYMVKTERMTINPFDGVDVPTPRKRKEENITEIFDNLYGIIKKEIGKRKKGKPKKKKRKPNNEKEGLEWFYDNEWFIHHLWIMLNTGMRSGEVSLIKWKKGKMDVGDEHSRSYVYLSKDFNTITIYFKRRKRELPVPPPLKDTLKLLTKIQKSRRNHPTYLFENDKTGKPHSVTTVGKLFKKLLKGLNEKDEDLKLDEDHTPHSIRHGYISHLIRNGGSIFNVSRIVGHSTEQITEMIYTHTRPDDVSDTMDILYKK
jgi:integrase